MDIDGFCKIADVEVVDCGPGWGGKFAVTVRGSNCTLCGFRTERAAKIAFIKEECGVFGNAVIKLLKAQERKVKTPKTKKVK